MILRSAVPGYLFNTLLVGTVSAQSYDDQLELLIADIVAAQQNVADILDTVEPQSEPWRADAVAKFRALGQFDARIASLQPPEDAKAGHEELVKAVAALHDAGDALALALESDNVSMLERGTLVLVDAVNKWVAATSDLGFEAQ